MVMWWIAVAVGAVTGVLSGMGIGGGTLLVLYLTAVLDTAATTAAGINLLYFLGCAPTSLIFHARQGLIDKRAALWAAAGGIVTALLAALLAPDTSPAWLERLFGALLLTVGVRELWQAFRSSQDGEQNNG